MSHYKTSYASFSKNSPFYLKLPILITLLISFSFNQATILLYKYLYLSFNN